MMQNTLACRVVSRILMAAVESAPDMQRHWQGSPHGPLRTLRLIRIDKYVLGENVDLTIRHTTDKIIKEVSTSYITIIR